MEKFKLKFQNEHFLRFAGPSGENARAQSGVVGTAQKDHPAAKDAQEIGTEAQGSGSKSQNGSPESWRGGRGNQG